jgi:hypothetical protein
MNRDMGIWLKAQARRLRQIGNHGGGNYYYYSSAKFYQDATNSFEMLKHYSGN